MEVVFPREMKSVSSFAFIEPGEQFCHISIMCLLHGEGQSQPKIKFIVF